MSLGEAIGLTALTIAVMFVLIFVLAGVETRMFADVVVEPEGDAVPALVEPAVELGQAA